MEVFMSIGDEINALINKGGEAYEGEKFDEAIEAFEKALAITTEHFPNDPKIQEVKDIIDMAKQAKSLAKQRDEAAALEARLFEENGRRIEEIKKVL
jgi:tetratricopeptide (TPR) repeat protein